MAEGYLKRLFTPGPLSEQAKYYGRSQTVSAAVGADPLTEEEQAFITARDSFYLATVNSEGWPYIQHRGGPPGFLKVLDEQTLGFADLKGNRQLLTAGNLQTNDRVSLFLMDYPRRERLKILGHARALDARENPVLLESLAASPELKSKTERLFLIQVVSFDWNCPQYITPRFTQEEFEARG